jgi:glycyl-tRNA synthetase
MMEKCIEEPITMTIGDAVERKLIRTEWQGYFMGLSKRFITALGVKPDRQRFRAHLPKERSHYSAQTFDHEVLTKSWGWTEVSGHANRTDFDLKAHMKGSGVDMTVLRSDGSRFIPYVIEPSFGLDRLFYVTLEANYERKEKEKRNLFNFPRTLAPYNLSVQPLVSKDGISEKAEEVAKSLLDRGYSLPPIDDSGSIGRRYARVDEIGIPLAVTIDYDTLKKDQVTLRDRDTWQQVSVTLQDLPEKIRQYFKEDKQVIELGELVKHHEAE